MPSRWISETNGGTVDSPTPMVPSSSDSTQLDLAELALQMPGSASAAAIHPDVPPPTITIFEKGLHYQFRFSTMTPGPSWEWAVL